MANEIVIDEVKVKWEDTHPEGSLWMDGDGHIYLLGIVDHAKKWAALSLMEGCRWRDAKDTAEEAVGGLTRLKAGQRVVLTVG